MYFIFFFFLEYVYFPCTYYAYSRSYCNQLASPSCSGLHQCVLPTQITISGSVIFSRAAVPVIISLHATVHACRSQYGRRDRIATVIAPQANSLFNWLGRRSGNHERSNSKGGRIANPMWYRIDIHASSGVAQSLQSISSDGVCVEAETEDQLRQIGLFGQSEGSLKMFNIRCKSKETTSFAGGVALSEEYITSEEDAGADTSRMTDTYIWIVRSSAI